MDLDKKQALRVEEGTKKVFSNTNSDVAKLMKLKGWFPFKVARAVIGKPMFLWVPSTDDATQTIERQSTTVRQIIKLGQ